jgi:hypothetical protein
MSRRDAELFQDAARSYPLFDVPGPTAAALRAVDWTQTGLGPPASWPGDLLHAAHTVVRSAAPMIVWWGEHYVQLHNDAAASLCGSGCAVARPAAQCWPEQWTVFAPHASRVIDTGERCTVDVVLPVDGAPATFWTMSLAPLYADDGESRPAGVLVNAFDLTARVTDQENERRTADVTNANLQLALTSNRRIGTAIGILMAHRRITDSAAFELLREASQRGHRKLREIAEDVVLTGTLPD